MAKLLIVLPAARDYCGRGLLLSSDGQRLFGPFRVLGTASRRIARRNGNRQYDRGLPFGDPPTGAYVIAGSLPPATRKRRPERFGHLGALLLQPTGGEAMTAADKRPRVVLHGGRCDKRGRLRRTRGGLRVADADLSGLLAALNAAQAGNDPVASVEVLDVPLSARGAGDELAQPLTRARRKKPTTRSWKAAALLACGAAGAAVTTPVSRRHFLGAALLLCGGLTISACNSPAPCNPIPCDPAADPSCPPDGYYCDYVAGGGVG